MIVSARLMVLVMDDKWTRDRDISRRLRRTWPAFFARFGRLTEVQRQVVPPLIEGKNLLVGSATASGKTEAACAPLLERFLARAKPWKILYISPTRALVNDLYFRLYHPCCELSCSIVRRIGDHREKIHPDTKIIITTPESFDSILCRGKDNDGHLLMDVGAVIMDEIHLLFDTPRGEQLRWLLRRLQLLRSYMHKQKQVLDESLQLVCLSATLPDPDQVAKRFLGKNYQIVTVPGSREINAVSVDSADNPSVEKALPAYIHKLKDPEKILVFCNRKKRVDLLATYLKDVLPEGFSVYAHHGSLGRFLRESAEKALQEENRVVVVATSTLEIGIDIGDVDLVVLDGPPPDVSSLLQRIGRGNRRTNVTRVMLCSNNLQEAIIHTAMLTAAINSEFADNIGKKNYGVIVQQIASYIFQSPKRYRTRHRLIDFLKFCEPEIDGDLILDHLIAQDEFTECVNTGRIRLGEEWLERMERGAIHSNIEGFCGITVKDNLTGEILATGINIREKKGKKLSIGGNLLSVKSWEERAVEVKRLNNPESSEVNWNYSSRSWINSDEQPYCVRKYLEIPDDVWPIVIYEGRFYAFHFGGVKRKLFLEIAKVNNYEIGDIKINNWYLSAGDVSSLELLRSFAGELNPRLMRRHFEIDIDSFETALGRPLVNRKLPANLRSEEIASWIEMEEEQSYIQRVRLVNEGRAEVNKVLKVFLANM